MLRTLLRVLNLYRKKTGEQSPTTLVSNSSASKQSPFTIAQQAHHSPNALGWFQLSMPLAHGGSPNIYF